MTGKYIRYYIHIRMILQYINFCDYVEFHDVQPCCGPELGAFALGEEDGLSVPVLSASGKVDFSVINWVVGV